MPPSPRNPVLALAFGETVRALREGLDVPQEAMALEVGMDRSYYGRVERGEKQPSLDTVFRLAHALEITPAELVEKTAKRVLTVRRRLAARQHRL